MDYTKAVADRLGIRKGQLKVISVVVKVRQGRKASTLITNFEPFFLTADFLSDELRRVCASATSGECCSFIEIF
jgi:translation initiation factor 1 (eIF-1/SUI1)